MGHQDAIKFSLWVFNGAYRKMSVYRKQSGAFNTERQKTQRVLDRYIIEHQELHCLVVHCCIYRTSEFQLLDLANGYDNESGSWHEFRDRLQSVSHSSRPSTMASSQLYLIELEHTWIAPKRVSPYLSELTTTASFPKDRMHAVCLKSLPFRTMSQPYFPTISQS